MSRGKYASTAEARRVRETAESEVIAGRRKIRDLLQENAEKQETIDRLLGSHSVEMRRMRITLAEGCAPEIAELRTRLATSEDARKVSDRKFKELADTWQRAAANVHRHFKSAHGMTGLEAVEATGRIVNPEAASSKGVLIDSETYAGRRVDGERAERLAIVHGTRRTGNVDDVYATAAEADASVGDDD